MSDNRTEIREIRADSLAVHPIVRRAIDWVFIKKLVDNFDMDAIGVLNAVEYQYAGETRPWIIDGNHRLKALMELGLGDTLVPVMVHLDVNDDASAARLLLALHNTRAQDEHNPSDPECQCGPCVKKSDEDAQAVADTLADMMGLPRRGNA